MSGEPNTASTIEPYWTVAQVTRPELVQKLLKREGYETYSPKIKVHRRAMALFPGYLMVKVVLRWHPVRWCPGVLRMLMNGERPAKLPDHIIAELYAREVRGFVKLVREPGALEKGQRVRVLTGTFAGRIGIYDGMSNAARERVLLEWLGQSVPAIMPIGNLEAVT
jgi:transcriptional antiterminator RfaH